MRLLNFFKPLGEGPFWIGLLACIMIVPLPFILMGLAGVAASDDSMGLKKVIELFAYMQTLGMLFAAAGCFVIGIPVFLLFESRKIRSKNAYLLAGFILAFIAATLFSVDGDVQRLFQPTSGFAYTSGFLLGILGSVSALIFWHIVIKPLTTPEPGIRKATKFSKLFSAFLVITFFAIVTITLTHKPSGDPDRIWGMRTVLYPDFTPAPRMTAKNRDEILKSRIIIGVTELEPNTSITNEGYNENRLANMLSRKNKEGERIYEQKPEILESGFYRYKADKESRINGDIYLLHDENGRISLFLNCNKSAQDRTYCGTDNVILDSLRINYSYDFSLLPNAVALDQRVKKYVTENFGKKYD